MTRKWLVIGVGLMFTFPILLLTVKSFAFDWSWGELWPSSFQLANWQTIFRDANIRQALLLTISIGFVVVALNLLIGIPAAKALAFTQFRGKALIDVLMLLPLFIPTLAVVMGLQLTMIRLQLTNSWYGVVLVHLIPTVPYTIRILRSGYERIGVKWQEQAQVLGATGRQALFTVELPLLMPSIRAAMYLTLVISFSQYVLTAIIGGGTVVTLAMLYFPYFSSANEGILAAFSILFALIPFLCLALLEGVVRLFMPVLKR
ncbi:ABC transporter permease [Shouchella shacheensis]|uniref:ABC transporter permease n=1 Tax=Shouchella shacheensis TaxID=1649580 RepID=UPI00073FDC83|nr:ABC transporter permease subunit [Shouchella shacheensis]